MCCLFYSYGCFPEKMAVDSDASDMEDEDYVTVNSQSLGLCVNAFIFTLIFTVIWYVGRGKNRGRGNKRGTEN